jgi:hypothetical protein
MSWMSRHPMMWIRIRLRQWPWLFIDTGDYLPVGANRLSFREAVREHHFSTIALKGAFVGGNILLFVFAVYGASSLRGRIQTTMPVWTFPLYLAAAHGPVYVEPRYGLPLVPFLTMLAAAGVTTWLHTVDAESRREAEGRLGSQSHERLTHIFLA